MQPNPDLPRTLTRPRRSPTDRLREALLALAGGQAALVSHAERAWASVTFAGSRHRVTLAFDGEEAVQAGELFIAFLPEHEFAIPGHLVADAAVTEVDHLIAPPMLTVHCELLLLEEA